jgi:putative nucleotidyltransferase with HDIG domain
MKTLNMLRNAFSELKVPMADQIYIMGHLSKLDSETYQHSVNVGIAVKTEAKISGLDQKTAFYGGLLHDIGKASINPEILNKPGLLTQDEWMEMKKHPEIGYNMINIIFPLPAEAVLRSHVFQPNSYPIGLPSNPEAEAYAKVINRVDYHDALSRKNERARMEKPWNYK